MLAPESSMYSCEAMEEALTGAHAGRERAQQNLRFVMPHL
jgi:hypothetical protein